MAEEMNKPSTNIFSIFVFRSPIPEMALKDIILYNPFAVLDVEMLNFLHNQGDHYIVVQRFSWPGIPSGTGYIASPYGNLKEAENHLLHLEAKEGKLLNVNGHEDKNKLLALLAKDSGFHLFINLTNQGQRIERSIAIAYRKKVGSYIRSVLKMKNEGGFDVTLRVEYGRLVATITSGLQQRQVLFYSMIK
ncbi:hypothetical protein MKQ70_32130 [Chitinophaga sedimenti]|uniref:hypothetical protein n=1 Tax=Chitinophaga sedimenti TaxID=2033606 RepID=UPI002005CF11|nr:hypothetical protein [Chitinophaga sedimenti]MCK7559367.1 hypothetical protein [Chitinophaga sedimenti]